MPHRVHLLIEGRVQGVFFRASTQQEARRLGLSGWVCNLPDGRVAAEATGDRETLHAWIAWCHEGPPHAVVTGVTATWHETDEVPTDFEIRR